MADGAIASGTWTNWAGNVRATPRIVVTPGSLAELRAAVVEAARRGETVRVAGAGHSFAPLCATDGTLLDLSRLAGVERVDPETGEATIWAGTRIADLGEPLLAQGARSPTRAISTGRPLPGRSPPGPMAPAASTAAFPPRCGRWS